MQMSHSLLAFAMLALGVVIGACAKIAFDCRPRLSRRRVVPTCAAESVAEQPSVAAAEHDAAVVAGEIALSEASLPCTLSKEDQQFSEKLMKMIEARMDQRNLQVDNLASEMAMSHTLFYERVHRCMGESPANVLRNYRLQRAYGMLSEHNRTVAEVALLCGFSDAKYFSTVFKKKYGVSPSKI